MQVGAPAKFQGSFVGKGETMCKMKFLAFAENKLITCVSTHSRNHNKKRTMQRAKAIKTIGKKDIFLKYVLLGF